MPLMEPGAGFETLNLDLETPKERNEREYLLLAVHPDSPTHLSMIIGELAKQRTPYRFTQIFLNKEEVGYVIEALQKAEELMQDEDGK